MTLNHAEELDEYARASEAAEFILARLSAAGQKTPALAVVLGSGLGEFAESLEAAAVIPYEEIPHFPRSTAIGHAGRLVVGSLAGVALAAMQGRVHQYEGYTSRQTAFPVRVFQRLGIRTLVLTNAAGGIDAAYRQGALVLIKDHINLQGDNPLRGVNDERFGPRFPDMTEAYSQRLRTVATEEAARLGIELHEGIYAALAGPSYETPAEIRYLRAIGADLVGMSTVPEVIAARHGGQEVLAISCVTNMAAGMSGKPLVHEEVLAEGERVKDTFLALLGAVVKRVAEA
jgi:purine-nucleoside phosphorylase